MDVASQQAECVPALQLPGESVLSCKDETKKLESLIFNHVSLGQWEAARACVGQLAASEDQATRENARELLKILIVEAANYWSESRAVRSPHHLSWLALNAYKELFTDDKDKLPAYLQELIEFRLLLFSCIGVVSFSSRLATQLCQYHAIHVLKIPGAVSESVPHFSGLVVSFIHDVITTVSPALGYTIITNLSVPDSAAHLANNESLQLIYTECIQDCLDLLVKLKNEDSPEPDSSYDSQYESDHPTSGVRSSRKSCEKIISMVYTILSLLDPSHDMVKLTKKIDTIFHTLLRTTYVVSSEVKVSFETGRIYACLLGRSRPFLINRLHEVEEYLRLHPETEETPVTVQRSTPSKLSLQLTSVSEGASLEAVQEWRGRFYEALYDHKHFLESTLEAGLQLVLTGQLQELSVLMKRQECVPLRPIMLLMGWDKYSAVGSGKELLDVLWPSEVSMKQRLLFNGCCKLAFQVELVQWCLEKAKPHLQHRSAITVHRAGEMFKGLETHSILFVLHHYTSLASLNPIEVIDILKMRPRVPLIPAVSAMTPPPQFSRGTTPMKWANEPESPPHLFSTGGPQKPFPLLSLKTLQPEQERDISIFRSFCAIRLIFDAIWTSIEIDNRSLSKPETKNASSQSSAAPTSAFPVIVEPKTSKAARKLDFGASTPEEEGTETDVRPSRVQYSFGVIEKLQEAKVYISQIDPLNYRLEILEDIFSLLFLTSADIKPPSVGETKETPGSHESKEGSKLEASLPSRWSNEFSSGFTSIALIRSKAGFLFGERLTSDLLLLLQDCINELRAAKFQQSQQASSLSTESKPIGLVQSSLPLTSLQQRSAQLEQYINEAKWRLQLVSSKSGILATLSSGGKPGGAEGGGGVDLISSTDESASELSESEPEEEVKKERKKHKKPGITLSKSREATPSDVRLSNPWPSVVSSLPASLHRQNGTSSPILRPSSPNFSPVPRLSVKGTRPSETPKASLKKKGRSPKSPEIQRLLEEDSGEIADVEDRSPDSPSKKRKCRRSRTLQACHRKRHGRLTDQSEGSIVQSSFICQMLSSPDSLLRMCVKQANYSRAKEVVKMFNMTGEFGEAFVNFSQQYELISRSFGHKSPVSGRSPLPTPISGASSHSQTPPPRGSVDAPISTTSLSQINLQLAIRTAASSSETLESLHRLLASSTVSQMLFSGDRALEKAAEESALLQILTTHVPALVMLDIVCSSKLEPVLAKRIIELATSRCLDVLRGMNTKWGASKRTSRVSQTHDITSVGGGPFALLQMFSDVLGYFMSFGVAQAAPTLTTPTYSSPHTLLTSGGHQLQVESIVNSKTFSGAYRDSRERIEHELLQFSSKAKKELFEELSECIAAEEPSSFACQPKPAPASVFDELIRALSSGKAAAGVVGVHPAPEVDEGGVAVVSNRFLWNFVRYVSKLLEFLTRCLGLGGAGPTKVSLLLSVLQESPSQVLGRLVFEREIPPQRLEALMEDFSHLNIVEVIIKCCCPQFPSALSTGPRRALPNISSSVVPLNEPASELSAPEEDVVTDLCSFSHRLLTKLISILKNSSLQSHSRDAMVTAKDLTIALENPELHNLLHRVRALKSIDLRTLDTSTKQMVFYSNIVNFLYTHAVLLVIAMETNSSKWEGLKHVSSLLSGSSLTLEAVTSSQIAQTVYFTKVGYFIGQLGLISCFDLHHTVLRQGSTPPTLLKGKKLGPLIKPLKPDPWAVHAPSTFDPRLVFVISDGRLSSPTPVPLISEHLEEQLSSSEAKYLSSVIDIELSNKESQISVPEWLFESCRELIKSKPSSDSDLSLLRYIHSKLDKEKAETLQLLMDTGESKSKRISVTVRPSSPKVGYNFTQTSSPTTSPKREKLSRQSSRKLVSPSALPEKRELGRKYSFTPEIVAFIDQRVCLLAALVHLLSPPPTGKTSRVTFDEKSEPSVAEEGTESSTAVAGRRGLLQSIRERVTRTSPPRVKKTAAVDTSPRSDWLETYGEVLSHFSTERPMYEYLVSRLLCFNSLIQWDGPPDNSPDSQKRFRVCLRTLAALPSSSDTVGEACSFALKKLFEAGQIMTAVDFLSSEPVSMHPQRVAYLSDTVLSCAFMLNYVKTEGGDNADVRTKSPLAILSQISDCELASRLTLASLRHWSVGVCLDLLGYCHSHLPSSSLLADTVKEKLDCMKVYSLIMKTCESPLHYSRCPWKRWYEIAKDTKTRPDYVLRMLLTPKAFAIARQWAAVHGVGQELSQQIEVDYLSHLLEKEASDPITAQQVLDDMSEDSATLSVCESLLEHDATLQVTIFVLHYVLSKLSQCLPFNKTQDYSNKLLGARALRCVPDKFRKEYLSLIMQPMLLVEQLLIDMKIDWACAVIEQLRADEHLTQIYKADTPILEHKPLTFSDEEESSDLFVPTIMFYCIKALEFPQPILVQNTPAQSLAPTAMSTRPPSPGGQYFVRTGPSGGYGGMDNPYPSTTPRKMGMNESYRPRLFPIDRESSFKLRPEPPTRDEWERDSDARSCPVCKIVIFGMFSRRHHCRRCGRVVCSGCSTRNAEVKGYNIPVRVCDDCFKSFESQAPPTLTNPPFDIRTMLPGGASQNDPTSQIRNHTLLPKDPMFNQNIRKEFYFERAPNTALFLSLVDLIVDKREAAGFILDCCHTVSGQLVPNSQGLVNEEVDHHFVIGLIQNLLQNAKVRFAQAEDSTGVELCDNYLSRVDLLRLLVASRCPKIPSINELTKPDLARRVRDRLMQSNRFKLAMEVSTKCQLDSGDVLSAWGMACLKHGGFQAARSKFKNCFQVSSHSKFSSSGSHNLQLLQRIVEQIEQTPLATSTRSTQYNEDWSSMLMSAMTIPEPWSEGCDLDKTRFSECVYYLTTYGSHSSLISFYVKHDCWLEACKLIREKNCSTEIFIDHLWVPAMKTGQIDHVEECLQRVDHTLSTWEAYLTAACRYFTQKGLFSVLYKTQLFMKDYIRAGMTCIKFFIGFSGRSTSIADLCSRLHYLSQAKKHFQTYLDVSRRLADRRGGKSRASRQYEDSSFVFLSSVKRLDQSTVQQHLATIELQTRVIRFLYQSAESLQTVSVPLSLVGVSDPTSSLGSTGSRSSQQPPTLFSNAQMRVEVAIQLLVCSQDIMEGFDFAGEVILAYRLSSSEVYCGAAKILALRHRYGDVRILLQCLQKAHLAEQINDEIVMVTIKVLANQPKEARQIEPLVSLLTNEKSKIKAYVLCGRLKSAYLVAIKEGEVEDVRHISDLAEKAGQIPVRNICQKWLQEHTRRR